MKQLETLFGEQFDKALKEEYGRDVYIENIQQKTKSGTPDRLICLRGRYVAVELKTNTGMPSQIQLLKLFKIRRAGGTAVIVSPDSFAVFRKELRKIYVSV